MTIDEGNVQVSQREFARRVGVTHRAIQAAIERGDLPQNVVLQDGRLDFAPALVAWTARDHRDDEHPKLAEVRAKLLELEYQRAIGRLVDAEDVRRSGFVIYRTTRDRLLNVADQIAPIVAAERDPARVRGIIFDAIETALKALGDWARDEADGEIERTR